MTQGLSRHDLKTKIVDNKILFDFYLKHICYSFVVSMNIQFHIKNLLYRHDCVTVKGLGGFVCQRRSAQLKDGYFLPPKKILTFNQSLNHDDGLLANQVAKTEKVSFQIAQQKIKSFAQKVFETLEDEQDIYLKDLGVFKMNVNHKLIFEPEENTEWLIESYGLPKFKVEAVQATKLETRAQESKPVTPVKQISEEPSKPNYWKYAAVGVIALGIAGLIGSQIYQNNIKGYNIAEQQKANELVNKKIQQSSFLINEPLKAISIEVEEEKIGKYHIVGGAFKVRANVDKKIKQLKKQGFDAKYIGTNSYGLHQVVYASFQDKNEALQHLRKIKIKNNPYAWLYVKEL